MFAKIVDGVVEKCPYSVPKDLKREYPQTSFPKDTSNINLADYNVYSVTTASVPEFNRDSEHVEWEVQLVDNVWTQVWTVSQQPINEASSNIRRKRDILLEESDWTQLPDVSQSRSYTCWIWNCRSFWPRYCIRKTCLLCNIP